jgi:hypothetical protein
MHARKLLVACALVAVAACSSEKRTEEKPAAAPAPLVGEHAAPWAPEIPDAPLTLLVTGDNWGEVAPCG